MTDHQRRAIRHARIAAFCLCWAAVIVAIAAGVSAWDWAKGVVL